MNKIWFVMVFFSLIMLLFCSPSTTLSAMVDAADSTVTLCLELVAVYAVWLGILELVEESGLSKKLAHLLSPLIKWLFKIDNEEIERMIALNMSANILGLGNAATPMGINAMRALDDGSGRASEAVIMLIVLNATSLQLLPSTIIGLRAAAGSTSSTDIILPTIICTAVTSVLGVSLVKFCGFLRKKIKHKEKR